MPRQTRRETDRQTKTERSTLLIDNYIPRSLLLFSCRLKTRTIFPLIYWSWSCVLSTVSIHCRFNADLGIVLKGVSLHSRPGCKYTFSFSDSNGNTRWPGGCVNDHYVL